MKQILKKVAIAVMSFGLTAPLLPAQSAYDAHRGDSHYQAASWRDSDRGSYHNDYRDDRFHRDDHYRAEYNRGYYRDDYYERDHRAGRTAAIVGGSAVAGALIGGAAGHGQGAVVGAIVGGIGGVIADQAVRHHDRRW